MSRPHLVIFDCDGVIVDSEGLASKVVAQRLTESGWPLSADEARALFTGGTLADAMRAAEVQGLTLSDDWLETTYARLYAALGETPAVTGAPELLDALDTARLPYCIASNGAQAKMDVTLASAGLLGRFDGRRFSAEEVAAPKPAPDLFLLAARRMGAAPEACVIVGDTRNDARAARAAGIPCFGYTADTPAEIFLQEGATPFARMCELPALIGVAAS